MKLSVVIVNYNVKYFLEQALLAVRKATQNVETEVFVVDNNSVDDSVEMVKEKFPEVLLIANTENLGFSKANNQAMRLAKGQYILLLNPDTVVREDTFEKTVAFMDQHPNSGGLGVKMIDGKGNFLPESKRGFPSPMVAFYKTFGLARIFPKSARFNRYHLGHLDKDQNHEIDILSGAFMLMRKTVLDKVGLLDETFFMYGEDIDLSYRITQAGYKNYYIADTAIIHYKGESTKRGSLNYVRVFYNAMIIFVKKHFQQSNSASLFILMLRFAIYFRAAITLAGNLFRSFYLPVLDVIVLFTSLFLIKDAWEVFHFDDPDYYQAVPLQFNFALYVSIWVTSAYIYGAYDYFARLKHLLTGICVGTIFISAIYGFLPSDLRFSRMLILLGTVGAVVSTISLRGLLSFIRRRSFFLDPPKSSNLVIVGSLPESQRVLNLLYQSHLKINFIGTVSPSKRNNEEQLKEFLGNLGQLDEIVHIYNVNEVIFCGQDTPSEKIINWMTKLGPNLQYKIVPKDSGTIIGSNSKNTAGDLYTIDISFKIASATNKRHKRIMDIILSLSFFLFSPILFFFLKEKHFFMKNILATILGKKTWVGYHPLEEKQQNLPKLSRAILSPLDGLHVRPTSPHTIRRINLFYAKDYRLSTDLDLLWKGFVHLGRKEIKKM